MKYVGFKIGNKYISHNIHDVEMDTETEKEMVRRAAECINRSIAADLMASISPKAMNEPETCTGNTHVFKRGAEYCLCGMVKSDL